MTPHCAGSSYALSTAGLLSIVSISPYQVLNTSLTIPGHLMLATERRTSPFSGMTRPSKQALLQMLGTNETQPELESSSEWIRRIQRTNNKSPSVMDVRRVGCVLHVVIMLCVLWTGEHEQHKVVFLDCMGGDAQLGLYTVL